jgi:hypothetical protein
LRTAFSLSGKWLSFLNEYIAVDATDSEAPGMTDVKADDDDMAGSDVATVTTQVKADDVDSASFVLASKRKNDELILGAIPAELDEKGQIKESWDGEWFTVGDGQTELVCPISDFEELNDNEDTYLAEVPAQVRFQGHQQWFDVSFIFISTSMTRLRRIHLCV